MLNRLKKMDWMMLLILAAFMGISAILIRSATHGNPQYPNYDIKTLVYYAAGFVVIVLSTLVDYRLILKTWYVWYALGIILLVAVYLFAPEINGAKGWFVLGKGFQFQPAEMMKIFLIIAIAALLGRRIGEPLRLRSDVMLVAATVFIPFLLVMIQP
ncbi:MAG: FtsW/RodA/SpoVE family cell cycle protein, partial [Cohnella sp.]|nr:FtsW/RodA/SpoVE family cell cycle protein [Cohnella sp.]